MKFIMKTNIDLTKDFTMNDVMSTEFFLYFKEYIKEMVEDQKIAKRDRKDEKHPCPEKRKYSCYEAYCRVINQRYELCMLYEIYYFMKKNRDFDWSRIKFTHKLNWRNQDYIEAPSYNTAALKEEDNLRVLNNAWLNFDYLLDIIKKYVEDGKE